MTYEQKPEVEARMGILPRCGRETQVQRCLPPLRPAMQTELPGDYRQLPRLQVEAFQSRQITAFCVEIRVENQGLFALQAVRQDAPVCFPFRTVNHRNVGIKVDIAPSFEVP
jgi:hypothetical protein